MVILAADIRSASDRDRMGLQVPADRYPGSYGTSCRTAPGSPVSLGGRWLRDDSDGTWQPLFFSDGARNWKHHSRHASTESSNASRRREEKNKRRAGEVRDSLFLRLVGGRRQHLRCKTEICGLYPSGPGPKLRSAQAQIGCQQPGGYRRRRAGVTKTLVIDSAAVQQTQGANWATSDHKPVCNSHVARGRGRVRAQPRFTCRSVS